MSVHILYFRIAYSVYELNKLKSLQDNKNLSIVVMYDIACILDKHLQVNIGIS